MGHIPDVSSPPDNQLDLFDILRVATKNWILILVCCTVGLTAAGYWLRSHPPEFVARALIKPLAREDRADQSTSSGGSLAGRLLGTETDDSISLYVSTIYSIEAIERAIERRGLAQLVLPQYWDSQKQEWVQDEGGMADFKRGMRRFFNRAESVNPEDPAVVLAALKDLIEFNRLDDKLTPSTFLIEVRTKDAERSVAILTALHEEALAYIRDKKKAYLATMLQTMQMRYSEVTERAYREAFLGQMMSLEKRLLVLRGNDYAVVEVIDPPVVASPPLGLPISLVLALGLVMGGIIGMVINLVVFSRKLMKSPGQEQGSTAPATAAASDHASG